MQQLHSHAARAAGGAGGRRVGGAAGAPADPYHGHPIPLGQADPSWGCCGCKGEELPLPVLQPHSVLGQPTPGCRPQQRDKPRARRGRGGSQLSPEVTILACAFPFTCSSAWSLVAASVLLPSPLSRSTSTHEVPTTPEKLWQQHPHKSLVTENIY